MRLLLINYEYPPIGGGAANATLFLARALVGLGHRVEVLTAGLEGQHGSVLEEGITLHRLPSTRKQADRAAMGDLVGFMVRSWMRVASIPHAERPDAAIAFFTIPSGPAALRLFKRAGVPYIVSLRGTDVPGHDVTMNRMHAITRPVRRRVLRSARAIVANSESLAATSRAADPFPVEIIPNGVDSVTFSPLPSPRRLKESEPFRLLFVGRVHREKNLGPVIDQLPHLPQVTLVVAGDGAQREALQARARELGVEGRIEWLGWQKKAQLPEIYRSADALINPSLYEGMPNVVLEAMASGLPVIVSEVPGNTAVIQPGVTGEAFPLDRPGVIAERVGAFVASPGLTQRYGKAARHVVETVYSWEKAAKSYLALFGNSSSS